MSSFIAETLMSAGVKDTERCSPNLSEISSKSDELRVDVMEFLRSRYEDFDSRLDETSMLYKRWEQLSSTFDSTRTLIQDEIDSKTCSTVELAENSGILEKVNATLAVLSQLIRVHKLHQTVNNLLTCKDFTQAIVELQQMREALNTLQRDLPQLNIIKILNIEYTTLAQSLKHSMTEQWNSVVNISKQESGDVQTITFNIQTLKNRNHLSELCKALHSEEMLKLKLGSFADSLKMAFHWIVNYPKTVVTEETSANTLSVCVKRTASSTSPSWPSSVYKQLYRLLKPLAHRLLSIPLNSGEGSTPPATVMDVLRELCATAYIDCIVKGCLVPSVPTNQSDLDNYKDVVMETKKIEDFFQQIGFISPTCTSLTSYLGNINVLFANKKCQRLLSRARKLMKMELFNTIQLDEKDNSNNKWSSFIAKRDDSNSKDIDSQVERLSENTLKFSACAISESCMELLTLVHEMMEEACISGHAACTTQILYTIRSMFELYTSVVSDHHRNSIETLPQVSALYYNNCMFLSHQMILLASQYKPRLSSILQDVSAVTFVDLVPLLRAQGTESFLDQIQFQKENLLEYLQAAEGFKYTGVEERYQIAHQSIKQCIHQLSHLKRVWVDVLPASNYSKSIGHLTACVVKEMMSSIMSLEDMSSDDAAKLHQLITMVREAAPALFPGDKVSAAGSLMKHCSGWSRFLELDIVLTASLHDIVDRWSEGKGPLAAEYSPEQVKSLIRALFQNTDRRAATLAKIC